MTHYWNGLNNNSGTAQRGDVRVCVWTDSGVQLLLENIKLIKGKTKKKCRVTVVVLSVAGE